MKRTLTALGAACLLILTACGGSVIPPNLTIAPHGGRTHSAQFLKQVEHAHLPPSLPTLSLSSTLAGCDSVTISNCGAISHQALGCYAPGTTFANCPTAAADFPTAKLASIATHINFGGAVLDTEPGDATPSQDPGWVRAEWSQGVPRPAIYANLFEMTEGGGVIAEMSAAGIPHCTSTTASHCYLRWVAAWDGNPAIPVGYDAKQWASNAQVDFDSFSSSFFAPAPPPPPKLICWGKSSTPSSTGCLKIEAQATQDWKQYIAFHNGLLAHQKQLAVVAPYPGYYQQTKAKITVPAYTGPSIGYLNARIGTETKWAGIYKARHDALVKKYHS